MKRIGLSLVVLMLAGSAFAVEEAPPVTRSTPTESAAQFDRLVEKIRFEEVQQATSLLLSIVEGHASKIGLKCLPPSEKAQVWLSGPMHELSDAKQEAELKTYVAKPTAFKKSFANCLSTCSCNAYSALLDAVKEGTVPAKTLEADKKRVAATAKKESEAHSLVCAKNFKNFCKSAVEKYLRESN